MLAKIYEKILEVKPPERITINDWFNAGVIYYKMKQYETAWPFFDKIRTNYSDKNYGYLWTFYNSKIFDSVNTKNVLVPDAEKLIEFSQKDSAAKDSRGNLFNASITLATYYNDIKGDKPNGLKYLKMAYDACDTQSTKDQLAAFIKQLGGAVADSSKSSNTATVTKP
jgi:tetratricopeptide (TPR) repeat protein